MAENNKIAFNKPPLTCDEHIDQLIERGLRVEDRCKAKRYLSNINYYRLIAYFNPFQENVKTHQFKPDSSFENILKLYNFDRELRLLVLDAVERIEISIRTQMTYCLSGYYKTTHPHLNSKLFNEKNYTKLLKSLEFEVSKSNEARFQVITAISSRSE